MTLSPKLGVVGISTLWHFRLPLPIQMFIKIASSPRLSGIGMPSPILWSHPLKMQRIVLLSSLLWWELGTNSLITGPGEWLSFRRFSSKLSWSWSWTKLFQTIAAQSKLASDTISRLWGQTLTEKDTVSYAANENIQWTFRIELAPWMGSFYERLVGIVKRSLRKAIGKVCLTSEQLLTILKEAEAVINSKPLVYVGEDINSYMTLTPAHFLTLNPKIGLPVSTRDDTDDIDYNPDNPEISSADKLLATWKKGLKCLGSFWKIWSHEYLLSLRERQQTKLKGSRVQSPYTANVRDVVLIKDDLPRGSWRLGRIQELIKSRDGQCRSARVLLASNKVIGRPLNLLYPIECQATEMNRDSQNQSKQLTADKQNVAEVQIDRVDSGATSRYLDDLLNIDSLYFEGMVNRIYPPELQLNKANTSDTEAPFLDLHLSISNGFVSSKIYDKRDDFDFDIVNFPFLDGDVPRSTSYGV